MALRRRFAQSFLFQIFPHLFKKPKNKWVDRTSTKPKGKFFMEFTLSSKYSKKCNRFSIVIVNQLHDWCHDGRGRRLKWCTKLDKLFVLIYFYWLHKIGSCSTLHFLCCYANYLTWKQKVPCIMPISILEPKFVRKKCALYTGKYGSFSLPTSFCPIVFCITYFIYLCSSMYVIS